MHEAQLHEFNSFITLTYRDECLPAGGTLVKRDFQLFVKRLRKWLRSRGYPGVRYFHCGEYGEELGRPHYHALLFGIDFPDKKPWKRSDAAGGVTLYRSETLDKLWGLGFCSVGAVTMESAGYVARYSMKKITGALARPHYTRLIPDTGELVELEPEYATMSRRPGVGARWYEHFREDVYPEGEVVVAGGRRHRSPKYYDKLEARLDPEGMKRLRLERIKAGNNKLANWNRRPARLAVRHEVKSAQLKALKRGLK